MKAQTENVKAIVSEVLKEQYGNCSSYRKGIAEMGADSESDGNGRVGKEEKKTATSTPVSMISGPLRPAEESQGTNLQNSTTSRHHYPPGYPYYPAYFHGYSHFPPPEPYAQPPPRHEGPVYQFFHR